MIPAFSKERHQVGRWLWDQSGPWGGLAAGRPENRTLVLEQKEHKVTKTFNWKNKCLLVRCFHRNCLKNLSGLLCLQLACPHRYPANITETFRIEAMIACLSQHWQQGPHEVSTDSRICSYVITPNAILVAITFQSTWRLGHSLGVRLEEIIAIKMTDSRILVWGDKTWELSSS